MPHILEQNDEARAERAARAAENMTGTPAPEFKSEEERFRTIALNFMGSTINLLLAISSNLADINLTLQAKAKEGGELDE